MVDGGERAAGTGALQFPVGKGESFFLGWFFWALLPWCSGPVRPHGGPQPYAGGGLTDIVRLLHFLAALGGAVHGQP